MHQPPPWRALTLAGGEHPGPGKCCSQRDGKGQQVELASESGCEFGNAGRKPFRGTVDHGTPANPDQYAEEAEERGIDVIVAGAGGAAHLPGMTAAETVIPVIGVPIENANHALKNAALFSIIDMPEGVPVLTVAPNAALNAGIAAAQILARNDAALLIRLKDAKQTIYKDVVAKDALLQKLGADAYLAEMQQNSFSNIPIGVIF